MQSSGRMPLPKIRFSSLPRPVWEHILARVEERQISLQDLRRLQDWVNAAPGAPSLCTWLHCRPSDAGIPLRFWSIDVSGTSRDLCSAPIPELCTSRRRSARSESRRFP